MLIVSAFINFGDLSNNMTSVERFQEKLPYKHWGQHTLDAYIYSDILDDKLLNHLEKTISLQLEGQTITYGTHRTTFVFDNSKHAIVKHEQNARNQKFVYDLTFEKDWWEQTEDTVKDWSDNYLKSNINPVFYRFLQKMHSLEPFSQEPENWIPYRWHMNVLEYDQFLTAHLDVDSQYFNTKGASEARVISLTFYLEDYTEGYGGDLYTFNGFVYKPKRNSAIGINGNQVFHGVNANLKPDKKPRYAFTTRWAYKKDLYLPGGINKSMYKLEWL